MGQGLLMMTEPTVEEGESAKDIESRHCRYVVVCTYSIRSAGLGSLLRQLFSFDKTDDGEPGYSAHSEIQCTLGDFISSLHSKC